MSSGNDTVVGLMNSVTQLGLPKTKPVDIPAWRGGKLKRGGAFRQPSHPEKYNSKDAR